MRSQRNESSVAAYSDQKVQEMVLKQYRKLRSDGILESLQDIYAKQPNNRLDKDNYSFTFDLLKNNIEEKMITRSKLFKILQKQSKSLASIELRHSTEVVFDNESQIYSQKLQSGLPIFKSIIYMRYQNNDRWGQLLGQEKAFVADQYKLNVSEIKANIPKITLFLEDQKRLNKLVFQFTDYNHLQVKDEKYPRLEEVQKRADVLAKLLLLSIYGEEHRKLKQIWKNDENYQEMLKNQKKLKSQMEPEKLKEVDQEQLEIILKNQVKKIIENLEEKANIIAHDNFKQHNGERAVQTKKSLEKLIATVQADPNPRNQLKMLVAYKQKKSW